MGGRWGRWGGSTAVPTPPDTALLRNGAHRLGASAMASQWLWLAARWSTLCQPVTACRADRRKREAEPELGAGQDWSISVRRAAERGSVNSARMAVASRQRGRARSIPSASLSARARLCSAVAAARRWNFAARAPGTPRRLINGPSKADDTECRQHGQDAAAVVGPTCHGDEHDQRRDRGEGGIWKFHTAATATSVFRRGWRTTLARPIGVRFHRRS